MRQFDLRIQKEFVARLPEISASLSRLQTAAAAVAHGGADGSLRHAHDERLSQRTALPVARQCAAVVGAGLSGVRDGAK